MIEPDSGPRGTGEHGPVTSLAASHGRTPVGRWAALVAAVALADRDIATLDDWATLVRLKPCLLRHRCRAAAARPKDSLDLARLLRAIMVADPIQWRPEDVLDVTDDRTLMRLLARGGVARFFHREPAPLAVLLRGHRFAVPPTGVLLLRELLQSGRPG